MKGNTTIIKKFIKIIIAVLTFAFALSLQLSIGYTDVEAATVIKDSSDSLKKVESLVGHYQFNMAAGSSWNALGYAYSWQGEYSHTNKCAAYEKNWSPTMKGNSSGSYLDSKYNRNGKIYKAYLVIESASDGSCNASNETYNNDAGMQNYPVTIVGPKSMEEKTITHYNFTTNNFRRSGWVDVTDFVQQNGYGWYYVCNVPFDEANIHAGADAFAGWKLIVIEENPDIPVRMLSLALGCVQQSTEGITMTINGDGIQTSQNGVVNGQLLYSIAGADPGPYQRNWVEYGCSDTLNVSNFHNITTKSNIRSAVNPLIFCYSRNGIPLSSIGYIDQKYARYSWYTPAPYAVYTKDMGSGSYIPDASDIELIDVNGSNEFHNIKFDNEAKSVAIRFKVNNVSLIGDILGISADIDTPSFASSQTTTNINNSDGLTTGATIKGKFLNTTTASNVELSKADLVFNIDDGLDVSSYEVILYSSSSDSTGTKLSGTYDKDKHTLTFKNANARATGSSIQYKITCTKNSTKKAEFNNSAKLSGYYVNNGVETNMYVDGIGFATSKSVPAYKLTINPNGGTYNNSTSSSYKYISSGGTTTIADTSRVGYTFNKWTLSGADSSLTDNTFTMGTENATLKANWNINYYTLDVNVNLDDNLSYGGYSDITFDVYINDVLTKQGVQDYCNQIAYNSSYKIVMKDSSKYTYSSSTYTGTIGAEAKSVTVYAATIPTVERLATEQSGNDDFYVYAYVKSPGTISYTEFNSWTNESGNDDLVTIQTTKSTYTYNGQSYNFKALVKSSEHKKNNLDEHTYYNIKVKAYNKYKGHGDKSTTFNFRYTLSYNYNKPSNASHDITNNSEKSKVVTYKNKYDTLPTPSLTGWKFMGWYTKQTDGNKVDDKTIYSAAHGVTVYAHWQPIKYNQTINYYAYEASGKYDSATHTWVKLGSKTWPVAYDSTFDAENHKADWGNVSGYHWWSIDDKSWKVSGARSTNSHYYPNTYRVNVDLNKGNGSTTPTGTKGNFDMEYKTYKDLGTPTRVGYTFAGWKTTVNNSTNSSLSKSKFTMGYSNTYPYKDYKEAASVKIAAQWNPIKYTIVYHGNGNWNTSQGDYTQELTYDKAANLIDTKFSRNDKTTYNNVYYAKGYEFVGWGTSPSQTTPTYTNKQQVNNLTTVNGDTINLYAIWKKTVTITFNFNGGKFSNSAASKVYNYTMYNNVYTHTFDIKSLYGTMSNGTAYNSKGTNTVLTKTDANSVNYRFIGYNTASNSTTPNKQYDVYAAKRAENQTLRDNLTLYAIWEPVLEVTASMTTLNRPEAIVLNKDLDINTSLGKFTIKAGTNNTKLPNSISTKDYVSTIKSLTTNGNEVKYSISAKGSGNIKYQMATDERILDIYRNGKDNTWYDTLNSKTAFNNTIEHFKSTSGSLIVPKYLGTKNSYWTSNPLYSEGTSVYALKFTCTQPSYYYNKYWNTDEQVTIYGLIFVSNMDPSTGKPKPDGDSSNDEIYTLDGVQTQLCD